MQQQSVKIGNRKDFVTQRVSIMELELHALLARACRGDGSGKPRMSKLLKESKLSQTVGSYADESGVCALGAVARMLDSKIQKGETIDMHDIMSKIDGSFDEFSRVVDCPIKGCNHKNSISSTIPHLNDEHNESFYNIGVFLERYDL